MRYVLHLPLLLVLVHTTSEFYKMISFPWGAKEGPFCFNATLCPQEQTFTWDFYFDKLIDIGARSFVLGGYVIRDSTIEQEVLMFPEWNESGFHDLQHRVVDRNGTILCSVEVEGKTFNKTVFFNSATEFLKKYPVDGFVITNLVGGSDGSIALEVIQSIKELNLTAALYFDPTDWYAIKESGVATAVDLNFVGLWPELGNDLMTVIFNTYEYAEEAVKNAILAGAKAEKMILAIPLLARATLLTADLSYSSMIYDYHADPKGNGSVIFSHGYGFYFFSQTRAVDKLRLVTKYALRGVMLDHRKILITDLYPWDEESVFYALATNSV